MKGARDKLGRTALCDFNERDSSLVQRNAIFPLLSPYPTQLAGVGRHHVSTKLANTTFIQDGENSETPHPIQFSCPVETSFRGIVRETAIFYNDKRANPSGQYNIPSSKYINLMTQP